MNYCENCHIVTQASRCPVCGGKDCREVREEDFCLLLERKASDCAAIKEFFAGENIPCVAMPSGDGFRSSLGLRLENEKLFVPYAQLERAKELVRALADRETGRLRDQILQHAGTLHMAPRLARKLAKKWKTEDVLGACKENIASARRIEDGGRRIDGPGNGHFLFCYADSMTLCVDSESLEILSVTFS